MVRIKTNQTYLLLEMDLSKEMVKESTGHKWVEVCIVMFVGLVLGLI